MPILHRHRGFVVALACVLVSLCAPMVHAKPRRAALEVPRVPADTLRTIFIKSAGEALVGEDAPWLAGWTLAGDVWNIKQAFADSSTRRVALVFFASWCAPCRHGLALLSARADELESKGVKVVLVDYSEDVPTVAAFLGANPRFTVVLDRYGTSKVPYLRNSADEVTLPQTVLIGRDLRIEGIISKEGSDYVDRILAGQ